MIEFRFHINFTSGYVSSRVGLVTFSIILFSVGCADKNGNWNNPHAPEKANLRVMYSVFTSPPKNLDPVRTYNLDEATLIDQIYEPPLEYHYLKRPYQLKPLTLKDLPNVEYLSADGTIVSEESEHVAYSRYTLKLKKGIQYQPHPAFAMNDRNEPYYSFSNKSSAKKYRVLTDFTNVGTKELVANDYIYQIKRMADPKLQFPIWDIVSSYLVGMKDLRKELVQARRDDPRSWLNLDKFPLEGVEEIDRYTFQITLHKKYPQFKYWLAFHFFAPIPMELDRFYNLPGQQEKNISLAFHPVGTGAFMMTKHDASSEIILERNPNFSVTFYPYEGEMGDESLGLLADSGKPLPFLDKIVFRLEKEAIPIWTKFLQGYYDRSGVGSDSFDQAVDVSVDGIALSDEMLKKGISLNMTVEPATYYMGFNMLDPVVGGYAEEQQKLRNAIAIAYDEQEQISIFRNGRGEIAMSPLPPGIFGYQYGELGLDKEVFDWADGKPVRKPIETAARLLSEAGYPGGRDRVTGQPLVLNLDTTTSTGDAARQSWLIKQFNKLGIQLNIRATDYNRFQDKMESAKAQIFFWGWFADYPDPENFLFLLYGPNSRTGSGGSGVNSTNYNNQRFNELFNEMKVMPNSPKRLAIIEEMLEIYRKDRPWASSFHPRTFILNNAWVKNFKPHGMSQVTLKYQDIDIKLRENRRGEWNKPVVWPLWIFMILCSLIVFPGYLAYRRRQTQKII
ncbi:MAG: peptide ABC transporter substrate-binding protein [Cellvibrionales bacterium TMED49]|nr:peptide ABC transporter substrate-binding protein [Porticoccaceae bacterium]OUU39002.1 MAG: peptide ABC transporter substrate-binding protein [Cellvibrionales bacterium TMED49]